MERLTKPEYKYYWRDSCRKVRRLIAIRSNPRMAFVRYDDSPHFKSDHDRKLIEALDIELAFLTMSAKAQVKIILAARGTIRPSSARRHLENLAKEMLERKLLP